MLKLSYYPSSSVSLYSITMRRGGELCSKPSFPTRGFFASYSRLSAASLRAQHVIACIRACIARKFVHLFFPLKGGGQRPATNNQSQEEEGRRRCRPAEDDLRWRATRRKRGREEEGGEVVVPETDNNALKPPSWSKAPCLCITTRKEGGGELHGSSHFVFTRVWVRG